MTSLQSSAREAIDEQGQPAGSEHLYDVIGWGYARRRTTDPRIAAHVRHALAGAGSVVNVGAGTGSYEPTGQLVIAVEPAETMLVQRRRGAAPAVRARAEALPFPDGAFDAALAVFTVHHWRDLGAGLAELRRVARRQVVLLRDGMAAPDFWLIDEYFPEARLLPSERGAPGVRELSRHLRIRSVVPVPVPADCADGFARAFWNRPEAYLDSACQLAMSPLAQLPAQVVARGAERLRRDLESGAWDARHGHLRALDETDLGYRVVVAE